MRYFAIALSILFLLALGGAGAVGYAFYHYGRDLPDYKQLATYEPPMVTRVHAGDGRLLTEFAVEKRVFVPISAMPKRVVKAFLSAEDKTFYDHPGIDIPGVAAAMIKNVHRYFTNRRPVGASTITQQVAKNFLLTNEVSLTRKFKEAILAFRIEQAFGKDRILELYLNEIYLGLGSYGIAAAALNYFDKSLDQLTLAEIAFLAGLPKGPNNYHPAKHPDAARIRRDYVVGRMLEDGYISQAQAEEAMTGPVVMRPRSETKIAEAGYFAEDVRRELIERFGEKRLYGGGLSVRTTLDTKLQALADKALRDGLADYDRRHGWRGPLGKADTKSKWWEDLAKYEVPPEVSDWEIAVVLAEEANQALIAFGDGRRGAIPLSELEWAREWRKDQGLGPKIRKPSDVLASGDVVYVEALPEKSDPEPKSGAAAAAAKSDLPRYGLRQIPEINGAIVAMDPHTGRVLAMTGGFAHSISQFDRATQAQRQPGSAFKPFVYLAGLDHGFTPASLILDAPFVIDQGPGLGKWKPSNYSHKFYGASPMRVGIERSRNLMTVRLAQRIGIDTVADYAEKFGVVDQLPRVLSMALGAGETTLMRITAGYAMLVNGGKRITPTLVDRIQDRDGVTIYRHDARACAGCAGVEWRGQEPPKLPDDRAQVADPRSAYQIVSMLKGVVERGTGRRISSINKPLAGKTGTTNDSLDTWFVGFSPDLAVGVFAGFDDPRSLGRGETGSSVAAPIFKEFMAAALKDKPAIPFRIPPGIRLVRVNSDTGQLAQSGESHVILEAFKPGSEPNAETGSSVLDGSQGDFGEARSTSETRGLY